MVIIKRLNALGVPVGLPTIFPTPVLDGSDEHSLATVSQATVAFGWLLT